MPMDGIRFLERTDVVHSRIGYPGFEVIRMGQEVVETLHGRTPRCVDLGSPRILYSLLVIPTEVVEPRQQIVPYGIGPPPLYMLFQPAESSLRILLILLKIGAERVGYFLWDPIHV